MIPATTPIKTATVLQTKTEGGIFAQFESRDYSSGTVYSYFIRWSGSLMASGYSSDRKKIVSEAAMLWKQYTEAQAKLNRQAYTKKAA